MNVNQYEIALQAEQWKVLYFPQTAHKRIGFAAKNMPPYLVSQESPEQFLENSIITQKVDIYALEITFYKLITHKYPVYERNIKEQGKKIAQLKCIERPSEIKDDVLWDLISKLLEFDPNKRIAAANPPCGLIMSQSFRQCELPCLFGHKGAQGPDR
ncbi:MAG: hypothetical protein EZS28_030000, partial [Streblomastix strix]